MKNHFRSNWFVLTLLAVVLTAGGALAQAPNPDPGWDAFVIRNASTSGLPPVIQDNDDYVTDAIEYAITESGQKAGLGTNDINGARIDQISTLHIDRLDDVASSGSLYGPYFNIWVTDGLGNYAVIANEPSNPAWAGSRWDVPDWDFLRTKVAKVYETPGWNDGTSWVHTYVGHAGPFTFEDMAGLTIAPPPVAYITDPANGVGSGAPDDIDDNTAYGYNWIFGDTADNYISGGDGFIVDNYYATADFPVHNVTQDTYFAAIQAAIDAADAGDTITVAAGHYEEQLHITKDNLTISGAGVGVTYIDSPTDLALFYSTSNDNYPVVFVDGCSGLTMSGFTVDGLGRGNANYRFQGVGFWNAGGSLTSMHVTNISDTPFSGAQHCVGIYAYNNTGGPYSIVLNDVLVDDYQKGGVALSGEGLSVDLDYVTTVGHGPTDVTAQNGIQISYGATGTVDNCSVSGNHWLGDTWWASGVLLYLNGPVTMTDTDVATSQGAISINNADATINGGTITDAAGAAIGAYSWVAKSLAGKRMTQPLTEEFVRADKAATVVTVDGVTMDGGSIADSWGVDVWTDDQLEFNMTGCSISNFELGFSLIEDAGGTITGYAADNSIAGNLTAGASSNTAVAYDARNNNWGDASGPLHPYINPLGLGDEVSDNVLFTPWVGRTTSVVADLATGPFNRMLAEDGYGYWEGTPADGLDDDYAPGFAPGAFQASVEAGDTPYTKYGLAPEAVFGRPVHIGELYSISYFTQKGTTHVNPNEVDWFCQMYTDPYDGSPGSSWYGDRINSEPYFSENIVETAGEWTRWQTDAAQPNRLRFFDSNIDFGGYDDGFLQDLAGDPHYGAQPIMLFGLATGSAWAEGFDGKLDGLRIELVSGEVLTMNFTSGNAVVGAVPASSGPLPCGATQDVTFGVELTADMPDLFLYNAVVRFTGEVDVSAVTDELPFTDDNENFFAMDNEDGSWTITGSTVGNPSYPVTAPGAADLFTITFTAMSDGDADITFDSLVLRDPDNNPIPVVTSGATITVDCTAPAAVTAVTADPHHNRVEVNWTHDGSGVDHFLVYRGLAYDTAVGATAYPEYDDLSGFTVPTRPSSPTVADDSPEWELAATLPAGTNTVEDGDMTTGRGIYYYEVFAVDEAGNFAAAANNDRATNYWLGDVNASGTVDAIGDISQLGASFGRADGIPGYNAFCDVGPTDDWSRTGIPTTDSYVNFEDLMIFSMNFGVVSATNKTQTDISSVAGLSWVSYDDGRYALRLNEGSGVKGVRVTANLPEGVIGDVTAGSLLDEQDEMTFLQNVGESLDVNLAVMGVNNGFRGTGDLFVVTSSEVIGMEDISIQLRGTDNSEIDVNLDTTSDTLTPRVFDLKANYPNPFNPMTKISFSLPEAQNVKLVVYSVDGRKVRTLVNETRSAGLHEVIWNGRNDSGHGVASGTYFYRIEAGPYSSVKKMTLMK